MSLFVEAIMLSSYTITMLCNSSVHVRVHVHLLIDSGQLYVRACAVPLPKYGHYVLLNVQLCRSRARAKVHVIMPQPI